MSHVSQGFAAQSTHFAQCLALYATGAAQREERVAYRARVDAERRLEVRKKETVATPVVVAHNAVHRAGDAHGAARPILSRMQRERVVGELARGSWGADIPSTGACVAARAALPQERGTRLRRK